MTTRNRIACFGLLLALGCESTPEPRCSSQPGEGGVDIDCPPSDNGWSEKAENEALEGFEERAPGGRP